jgi:hypothetical protein
MQHVATSQYYEATFLNSPLRGSLVLTFPQGWALVTAYLVSHLEKECDRDPLIQLQLHSQNGGRI